MNTYRSTGPPLAALTALLTVCLGVRAAHETVEGQAPVQPVHLTDLWAQQPQHPVVEAARELYHGVRHHDPTLADGTAPPEAAEAVVAQLSHALLLRPTAELYQMSRSDPLINRLPDQWHYAWFHTYGGPLAALANAYLAQGRQAEAAASVVRLGIVVSEQALHFVALLREHTERTGEPAGVFGGPQPLRQQWDHGGLGHRWLQEHGDRLTWPLPLVLMDDWPLRSRPAAGNGADGPLLVSLVDVAYAAWRQRAGAEPAAVDFRFRADRRQATLRVGETTLLVEAETRQAQRNGRPVELSAPVEAAENDLLVPLPAVLEVFGWTAEPSTGEAWQDLRDIGFQVTLVETAMPVPEQN